MPRAKIIKHLERENWDGPWKKIITLYFHAFMQFFFPQIHALIDWEKEIVFLDKELEQISRRTKKSVLIVDKLVKVFLNDGKEQWFIIHVEIQVQGQDEFPVRMFTYNYRAFDIHKKEVVSLAVLADDDPDWRPSSYGYSCLGLGMNFTFHTNKLLDYKADWEYLENSDNPFAMVVMCHLKNLETHQKPKERYQWKRLLLQKLLEKNWSHTQIADLFDYVDWLMILPESLEKGLEEEMAATAQKKNLCL